MGAIRMTGSGAGADLDVITATASDVLENKTTVDNDGEPMSGTMPDRRKVDPTIGGINATYPNTSVHKGDSTQITQTTVSGEKLFAIRVKQGYHNGGGYIGVSQADAANAGGLTANKIMAGKSAFEISGTATSDANATAGTMLTGSTAYVNGQKVTGSIPKQSADADPAYHHAWATRVEGGHGVWYLGVRPGYYLDGVLWIRAVMPTFVANNIREGVTIGNLTGTMKDYSYLAIGQTSF